MGSDGKQMAAGQYPPRLPMGQFSQPLKTRITLGLRPQFFAHLFG